MQVGRIIRVVIRVGSLVRLFGNDHGWQASRIVWLLYCSTLERLSISSYVFCNSVISA